MIPQILTKICNRCDKSLPKAEFPVNGKNLHRNICSDCHRAESSAFYHANKEEVLAKQKAKRDADPEAFRTKARDNNHRVIARNPLRYLLKGARSRAKTKGIPWTLTRADEDLMHIPLHCPILGFALDRLGLGTDRVPSIDRLDSAKGYEPGNVHIISWRANTIKSMGTAEEHEAIATWVKKMNR